MKIKDFENKGINVVDSMGEKRMTKDNSIVFPNGWVASLLPMKKDIQVEQVS